MKTKDIITFTIAITVIVACVIVAYMFLFPSKKTKETEENKKPQQAITGVIDENTFKTITNLSDYGKPNLDNLGKSDLFAGF